MGNALLLNQQLINAESYHSTTFRNRPLNGGVEGKFTINWIEAFTLFWYLLLSYDKPIT